MFHPVDHPLERGWVGRVDGDIVVHLAAQTLQSYFLGGGGAREHAVYPLSGVVWLAPVLHPPVVRVFEAQDEFVFANATAVAGPGAIAARAGSLTVRPRLAAIVGVDGDPGGFTLFAEWRNASRRPPKDRDFALSTGPLAVTPDAFDVRTTTVSVRVDDGVALEAPSSGFDWARALTLAGESTRLRPGDLIAGPALGVVGVPTGAAVEVSAGPLGTLALRAQLRT
jgi:hypothetical protein